MNRVELSSVHHIERRLAPQYRVVLHWVPSIFNFQKAGYEGSMWSRKDKDGDTILVATHVDDSIVTGSNDEKIDAFIAKLLDRFDGTCVAVMVRV